MPYSHLRKSAQPPSDEEGEDLEPLEDKTEALTLRSKKTERVQKRQQLKAKKPRPAPHGLLLDLPYELLLDILYLLRPSDIFNLRRAGKGYDAFITSEESRIAQHIVSWRYSCLAQCFRLPVLIRDMQHQHEQGSGSNSNSEEDGEDEDIDIVSILQSSERQDRLGIHKRPYSHDLDQGEPLPSWARNEPVPEWNRRLLARNADVAHLDSTTRANRRHAANKGNKRRRFQMTREDADAGTDAFLERNGPPTFDFPFHRDNYYMLEAYLPNRAWIAEREKWMYVPATQHDYDIQQVKRWAVDMRGKRERRVAPSSNQGQLATTTTTR
ncbi:hypothetical protein PG999_012846 [Apiospora kogelbergensis]|uniref:F-box domain-containing protein n=1 Tax=Apiospora kogelbergensis TaxID=1337665 RepID=A0AAW0QA47_9PEZI